MRTAQAHRCHIIPPHLLKHLTHSSNTSRAERARATLLADSRHRAIRSLRGETVTPAAAAGEDKPTMPNRTINDAKNSETLPGKEVRSEGEDPSKDPSVNRAYAYLGDTYTYYRDVHRRDSLDGKGMPLIGTVHYGHEYMNAFWDGTQMAFGDGDGELFRDFTMDPTVIAHELSHGVIERTTGFVYFGESGALNEHVADLFGVLAVQYKLRQKAEDASWLVGAELFTGEVEGAALRSLKAPGTAYDDDVLGKDPQPAHMDDYVHTFEDNGGVHINGSVPSLAAFLLAIELDGYAYETVGPIWYDTLINGDLKPDTRFEDFAAATCASAVRLHGDGSAEAKATQAAWGEVGIKTRR